MYTWCYRIRYSECNPEGYLTMPSLLALFQDVGYRHADEAGRGISYTRREGKTYFLLAWHIDLLRAPAVGEEITLSTWFSSMSGSLASKSILCTDAKGETIAVGDTRWAYMDVAERHPCDPPKELWEGEELLPAVPLSRRARRLRPPSDMTLCKTVILPHAVTDTNRHANNVRFVQFAAHEAQVAFDSVRTLSAEYRREAKEGECLLLCRTATEAGDFVTLSSESGECKLVCLFGYPLL